MCYWQILSVSITLYIYLWGGERGREGWGEGERGREREGESVCYWQTYQLRSCDITRIFAGSLSLANLADRNI